MSKYRNVLGGLYLNCAPYPPFKGFLLSHKNWIRMPMDRTHYRIYDLKLWFETDFEYGEELINERVSENGKYCFIKHMRCFE